MPMPHGDLVLSHFGVIAPPLPSHYRVLQSLAAELISRGHRVTFIHQQEAHRWLDHPGIRFHGIGLESHPPGTLGKTLRLASLPGGPFSLRRLIEDMSRTTDMLCRELPDTLSHLGIDALICDQMEAAGGLVAEALGLPYASVACALPVNREAGIPLPVMPMDYRPGERAEKMYEGSTRVYDWMMTPHRRTISRHAKRFGLSHRDGLHECLSPYAQISQTVTGFDFPRRRLPAHFHAVGPIRSFSELNQTLPFPVSPTRPLVFVSLGTLLGQRFRLFRRIVRACRELDVQILLAHCGGLNRQQVDDLQKEGATWVTDFAPQQAALARADAVICHGGWNTVLDALATGTPLLALPLAFDHHGSAARVVYAGTGLRASAAFSGKTELTQKLTKLLLEPGFRQQLSRLRQEVTSAGGTCAAADIVETLVRPVKVRECLP